MLTIITRLTFAGDTEGREKRHSFVNLWYFHNINVTIYSKFASHQRTMVNSKHYDVTIWFSAMSGNNTESTESITKKRYVTETANIQSMRESWSRWPLRAASQPSMGLVKWNILKFILEECVWPNAIWWEER